MGALTIASDNPLALLTEQSADVTPQESLPYVGFFSKKAEAALEIQQAISGIKEGEPFVRTRGGNFEAVTALSLIGPTTRYWCKLDNEYKIVEATFSDPGRGSGLKEHVVAPVLAYTANGVHVTLTTFRPTKCKAVTDVVTGIARATEDACGKAGPVGKQLAKLPQSLRVAGEVDVISKTSQAGFGYCLARCRTRLLSDKECEFLANALSDDAFGEQVTGITDAYNARVAVITKAAE